MRPALADATIVFDLDGTLVDTAPDLLRALNQVLDAEGLPRAPESAVRHLVGAGARAMIERGAGLSGAQYPPARLDQLTEVFVEFYGADIAARSRPYPNAVEALDTLAAEGARLAVCTNKRTGLSVQLLEALGLAGKFAAIVGADSVQNRKPHPEHFIETVARAGGVLTRALMVGDSEADVRSAQGAGAPVVLCQFGYGAEAAEPLGADALIFGYEELAAIARRLLAPKV